MAFPSVTYTFSNGTASDGPNVSQNFSDLVNGLSDGTKDLSINAATLAGTLTANGNVVLGSASGDTLTVNASLASHVVPDTNVTYDLGSSTLGMRAVYLGNSTFTTKLQAATLAASYTMTLPAAVPSTTTFLTMATTGAMGNSARIICGNIASNGSVNGGSGFTITKGGTGVYDVVFSTAFSNANYTLVGTATANDGIVLVTGYATTSAVVNIRDNAGNLVNAAWSFIVAAI